MADPPREATLRAQLEAYLQRSPLVPTGSRVVPLTGDASTRRYFRVHPTDGESVVLALHGSPFDYATLPFVNVAELFGRMAIPVPRIRDHADDLGILALEDLGDVTLQAYLGAANAQEQARWYTKAIELLALLQRRAPALASPGYAPYGMAFDEAKLVWELEFFSDHFLGAFRGVTVSAAQTQALREQFSRLASDLAAEPRVLCHRDYHSRNLMVHRGRLYVIDFQDARMGPASYDLVSLLRDSYHDVPEGTLDPLIDRFRGAARVEQSALDFRARFDTMTIQRALKALGTFGYQIAVNRNPVYLQYLPRTLRYVREGFERRPRFARLHGLLCELLPELR